MALTQSEIQDFVTGRKVIIHLIHPDPSGKINTNPVTMFGGTPAQHDAGGGVYDIACKPGSRLPTHATDQALSVTCPACKESETFKKILAEQTRSILGGSEADTAMLESLKASSK